jgi:hypothetical protein
LELISNWGLSNVYFTVLTLNFVLFVFLWFSQLSKHWHWVLIDSEFPEGASLLQKIPCGLLHLGNCELNILVTNTQGPLGERVKHIWSLFFKYKYDCLTRFPKFMK